MSSLCVTVLSFSISEIIITIHYCIQLYLLQVNGIELLFSINMANKRALANLRLILSFLYSCSLARFS